MKPKPKTFKVSETLQEENQVLFLRDRISKLNSENKVLRLRIESSTEWSQAVASAVVAEPPLPPFKYATAKRGGAPVVPFLKLSDWQIGEVVKEDETEGFSRFDWAIAQERIYQIVEDFLKWVEVNRDAYSIEEVAISCEGDFISGDIHEELRVTNEFPVPVQTAKAGALLGEVVRIIAPHFKRVKLLEVGADNHGRLTRKPQFKQKTANNLNFLVYEIVNSRIERLNNVKIERPVAATLVTEVNGWKFMIEHGDSVRGWMGLPFYGWERKLGKEARRRMNTDRGFHYWSIGHWHAPTVLQKMIYVNGCITGTTELDHLEGRFADPAQVAFLIHKEHGIFNWTPFHGKV